MSHSTVSSDRIHGAQRSGAGTIKRIRLENFMCHSSLEIELCEWVNFITGQNGSGKSAILTALCIAFGCRAKETQRAYAVVQVEIKNEGVDAFRPETYGDSILIERRITESTSSTILKDRQGRKVASRREDLRELVEHFNIDVENPCVIMSQDKSREFLHSGNDKDKFKFFFKATLLQQVEELLQNISKQLKDAYALVNELENSIRPIELELRELQEKIDNMERVEEISRRVQQLRKLLAWLLVYDMDQKLPKQREIIETLKNRIPACQAKIDSSLHALEKLQERFSKKKVLVSCFMENTSELKKKKEELSEACRSASKEKKELEAEHDRCTSQIQKMLNRVQKLEEQVYDIQEKHIRNTQAEESEIEAQIKELEHEVDRVKSILSSLEDDEYNLSEHCSEARDAVKEMDSKIKDYERKQRDIERQISELRQHQTNRVTAFGGDGVLRLLREIERHHHQFTEPPIGPLGAHVTLVSGGDAWAPAVEQAVGKLPNAFIVTNSKDVSILRKCGRDARYNYFPIIVHKFSRPRVTIPNHSLPQTRHPTTLSLLHADNPTVFNVLVDSGKAERQVLVKDYNSGTAVAFDQRIPNLLEVFTLDGFKMFSRGSVQTILPPNKRIRIGRLCGSFDGQIKEFQRDGSNTREEIAKCKSRKKELEMQAGDFQKRLDNVKRKRLDAERVMTAKRMKLQDVQNSRASEAALSPESTTNELLQEISNVKMEIKKKEAWVETLRERMKVAETKARSLELSHKELEESTKEEIEAFGKAEEELIEIERNITDAKARVAHYQSVMNDKVLPDIKEAEAEYLDLENRRKDAVSGERAMVKHGDRIKKQQMAPPRS
ncbi:Prefoldin [Corchorus olitorius]|uniref:Prefoldin n=1 Tax=Corchorus olitorius TaxID=93759 RepID=A0A1R3JTH8_9ROSI|nr:Prefoldin [Corchorus olitorius]